MDSPNKVFSEIIHQLSLLQTVEEDYEGKIKGEVYLRRVTKINNRLNKLKITLRTLGKNTIKIYSGELSSNSIFEFAYDANIPENEVIQYIEFLSKSKVNWYRVKTIIKTGEIIFTRKN